jgi:RNA polymerase sigma factor (sigma-70 family)
VIWSRERREVPFEEQYRALLDHAYFVGYRFFADRHLAEEVAQESLTRAYERWERVERHPNQEAWVMNAAWKVCMEMKRRQSRAAVGSLTFASLGEELVVERPVLVEALAKLTTRQRTVAMARYYFGYDVAETASVLGMTESQVRTASHEATLRLRSLMTDQEPRNAPLGGTAMRPA